MQISIKEARRRFFPNPKFELIYLESVANALDAGAKNISINIDIEAFGKPDTLMITVADDGVGFTDENYAKFSTLLMRKDAGHKGLGRLVYLEYFDKVLIESCFKKGKLRKFVFDETFSGAGGDEVKDCDKEATGTVLKFQDCISERLKTYDDIRQTTVRQAILHRFLPRFLSMVDHGLDFRIDVTLNTDEENDIYDFKSGTVSIVPSDLPVMKRIPFKAEGFDLLSPDWMLYYHIERVDAGTREYFTSLSVDERAMDIPLLSDEQVPMGVKAFFILQSDFLESRANDSRQEVDLAPYEKRNVCRLFSEKIAEVLDAEIPEIPTKNAETKTRLEDCFPHLAGLFEDRPVGLINPKSAIEGATKRLFDEKKDIFEASELTDEQYSRSLGYASRALMEYILYRDKIIKKIAATNKDNPEADIHNMILPMHTKSLGGNIYEQRYTNNAWLLDDKFMSFQCALSDEEIKRLIPLVSEEEEKVNDDMRPDIALVFSDDMSQASHAVDVVVIELKKRDTIHLRTMDVISQLKQRARRLLGVYGSKIQRMWFFGIVDFDPDTLRSLKETWLPIFSTDYAYYKEEPVIPVDACGNDVGDAKFPVFMTLWSYKAFVSDAMKRNETFMQILKGAIKEGVSL